MINKTREFLESIDCFSGGSSRYWSESEGMEWEMYLKPSAIRGDLRNFGADTVDYKAVECDDPKFVKVRITVDDETFYQTLPIEDCDIQTAQRKAFAVGVALKTGYGYGGLPSRYKTLGYENE